MGCAGFTSALEKRVECMQYMREKLTELAGANGERMLETPHNTISMVRVELQLYSAAAMLKVAFHKRLDQVLISRPTTIC